MSSRHISFQILLPESANADAFQEFMTGSYLPAVRVSPTRTGQVTALTLWRRLDDAPLAAGDFLLDVSYVGTPPQRPIVDDPTVTVRFEDFGAVTRRLGAYSECTPIAQQQAILHGTEEEL
jgi:hypothetical protein